MFDCTTICSGSDQEILSNGHLLIMTTSPNEEFVHQHIEQEIVTTVTPMEEHLCN